VMSERVMVKGSFKDFNEWNGKNHEMIFRINVSPIWKASIVLLVSTTLNGENKKVETIKAIHIGDFEITF